MSLFDWIMGIGLIIVAIPMAFISLSILIFSFICWKNRYNY